MIAKMAVGLLLAMAGTCVNVDVVRDGLVVQYGPVTTVSVAPTTRVMATMVSTTTTIDITTRNVTGATIALRIEPEVGPIPQNTIVATTSIPTFVPNGLDRWDLEQKRKAGVPVLDECPMDGTPCDFDEEMWLSHLPTLGELIDAYFEPEDREFFTWLAYCESSGKPQDIYSDAIQPQSKATGWFQHLPKFWIERSFKAGFTGFSIDHPEANVGVAAWLFYEGGGAKHWKACTRKYLREEVPSGD